MCTYFVIAMETQQIHAPAVMGVVLKKEVWKRRFHTKQKEDCTK